MKKLAMVLTIIMICFLYALAIEDDQMMCPVISRTIAETKDYDSVEPFVNGYAVVCKNDAYGLIDEDWNEIIPPQGWFIETFNHWDDDFVYTDYGFCILCAGDYYGVYDIEKGELVLSDYYQGIKFHRFHGDLYALAYKYEVLPDSPFYDYTEENTPLIDVYRLSRTASPSLIISQKATRCDCNENSDVILFNTALEGVVYCAYDHAGKLLFSDLESKTLLSYRIYTFGYLVIKDSNNEWIVVDDTGREILRSDYDELYAVGTDGLLKFRDRNGLYGFINLFGEVVIPADFDEIYNFCNNKAIAVDKTNDLYYIIDNDGSKLYSAPIKQTKVAYWYNVPYLMKKTENTMIFDYDQAGWLDYDKWIALRHPEYMLKDVYKSVCVYKKNIYIAYTGEEWLFVRNDGSMIENTVIGEIDYGWGPFIEFNKHTYDLLL